MTHTIGMLGPINVDQFRDLVDEDDWSEELPSGTGGIPVNLLSRELVSRGVRMLVVSLDPSVQDEVVLRGPNLKICIGPVRGGVARARDFWSVERKYLHRVLRRERPDLVHAQWTYEYALAAQKSGLPHVITAHDAPLAVLRHNFIPYRIARTMMAFRVASRAKRLISVSPFVASHLARFMLYRGSREVIPNGMPESMFGLRSTRNGARRSLTFASVLQGWGSMKNAEVAIEAFARVRRVHPEARLVLFGYGHGPGEEAERWSRERGFAEGVEFVGEHPHAQVIETLAREVDVLVHPSLLEANCLVLLEAMTLGVPVIAGKAAGGTPWTLDDGKAGILVDVKDAAAVARAMERLAQSREEREAWGQRGLSLATRRYHIRHVADAYERVYAELLGGASGNGGGAGPPSSA